MEYVESYPTDRLPTSAGAGLSLTVTLDLDTLVTGLGAASLSTGERISAGETRRLACRAGLVPAVLGTDSTPLDLGRTARLYNLPQRRALVVRDGGCTTQGCGLPPGVCHAHHDDPLVRRRSHRPAQRPAPVPTPPPARPRPPLQHAAPPRPHRHLPPTMLTVDKRAQATMALATSPTAASGSALPEHSRHGGRQ
jgi:hypothetical protein